MGSSTRLFVAPDSDLNILNALNDQSLRSVFEHLEMCDLVNVADVCVRFKQQAKPVFEKKYKNVNIPIRIPVATLKTAAALLRNFGEEITALQVYVGHSDRLTQIKMLQMIEKYTTHNLKELTLSDFNIQHDMNISSLIGNVEKLELYSCTMDYKLLLGDLMEFNSKLKKLVMKENVGFNMVELIRSISRNFHNLVELEIDEQSDIGYREFVPDFCQLTQLKSFTFHFSDSLTTTILKNLAANYIPIEHLALIWGRLDEDAVEAILQLKKLKTIKLDFCSGSIVDLMTDLAEKLPSIREVKVKWNFFDPYVDDLVRIDWGLSLSDVRIMTRSATVKFV